MYQVCTRTNKGWHTECLTEDSDYALEVANMLLAELYQIKITAYPLSA